MELQGMADSLAQKVKDEAGTNLGLAVCGRTSEEQTKGEFRFKTCHSLATPTGMERQENDLGGEPQIVRERSSIIALDLLRKYLLQMDSKV
jgi:nicotinamide mononucleotide (NMN) deamidase PncC